jgi:hypothetical protein
MVDARDLRSGGLDPLDLASAAFAAQSIRVERSRVRCAEDPWAAAGKQPHPKQRRFTDAVLGEEYDTIIHFGSARAGKSAAACLALLGYGYRWPGSRFLIGRYDYKRLWDSTMVSMGEALGWLYGRPWQHIKEVTPEVGRWEAGVQHLRLVEGPTLVFTHFKEAGSLGSTEYDVAWIEEAQELPCEERDASAGEERSRTPEVVTMVQSRLNRITRSARWGPSCPKLVLTAMGWGRNWVYEMAYGRG